MSDPEQLRHMTVYGDLLVPLGEVWRALLTMPHPVAVNRFDFYAAAARALRARPGWPSRPAIRRNHARLMDFAYRVNDMAIYLRANAGLRRRLPAYGAALAQERRQGRVPVPVDGVHVAIGFHHNYSRASRAAFVVVPWRSQYAQFDFGFLAGLSVEILATGVDLPEVDELAFALEAQGVGRIQFRRIDGPFPAVLIYDAAHYWLYHQWQRKNPPPLP